MACMPLLMVNSATVFAEEVVIEFEQAPRALFGPPRGSGYTEAGFAFFPIESIEGLATLHVHGRNAAGDPDRDSELVHHADAGGWFMVRDDPDNKAFSVKSMEILLLDYTDNSPNGVEQPLVIDGLLDNQIVASVELFEDSNLVGEYIFPSEFQNIDRMDVYFKTWRGTKPDGVDPNTGEGGDVDYNIIVDGIVADPVNNMTPAVNTLIPKEGLWWNPERSGHGVDIQYDGVNLIIVWYTYNADGTPTWYLASGPLSGTSWTSSLDTYTWDGATATATSEGTVTLEFTDSTNAQLSWVINGVQGSEPFQFFVTSSQPTTSDYTGIWFEPGKPGYGASISTQGNTEFIVVYFYDEQGLPRWGLGVNETSSSTYTTVDQFTDGFCPGCDKKIPVTKTLGTVAREFNSQSAGTWSIDFVLIDPLSGSWKVDNTQISNLSN